MTQTTLTIPHLTRETERPLCSLRDPLGHWGVIKMSNMNRRAWRMINGLHQALL